MFEMARSKANRSIEDKKSTFRVNKKPVDGRRIERFLQEMIFRRSTSCQWPARLVVGWQIHLSTPIIIDHTRKHSHLALVVLLLDLFARPLQVSLFWVSRWPIHSHWKNIFTCQRFQENLTQKKMKCMSHSLQKIQKSYT